MQNQFLQKLKLTHMQVIVMDNGFRALCIKTEKS